MWKTMHNHGTVLTPFVAPHFIFMQSIAKQHIAISVLDYLNKINIQETG